MTEINNRLESNLQVYSRTSEIDCLSSVPGLSIPIGLASDSLPIGLQLHSRPGEFDVVYTYYLIVRRTAFLSLNAYLTLLLLILAMNSRQAYQKHLTSFSQESFLSKG